VLALTLVLASPIVGRWDLVLTGGKQALPAWLEITSAGDRLAGRWQGPVAHARPVGPITIEGSRFSFVWPNDSEPGDRERPARIMGTVIGTDSLRGTVVASDGRSTPFTGVRAPKLAPAGTPHWGRPIDLFAEGLAGWRARDPAKNAWSFAGGVLANAGPSSDLVSRRRFTDFRLHAEVNVPPDGNSGIYLRGRHEIQVLDSYGKAPHSRQMGGIYGQVTPTSLPAKRAGEWQVFDVTLVGRVVTVVLNGVTIIDQQEIPGITGGALDSAEGDPGPIMLQGDHTAIRYRNVVLTPREESR
jgi:hypothetical protein